MVCCAVWREGEDTRAGSEVHVLELQELGERTLCLSSVVMEEQITGSATSNQSASRLPGPEHKISYSQVICRQPSTPGPTSARQVIIWSLKDSDGREDGGRRQ